MKITVIADCHLNNSLYKGVLDKKHSTLPFRTVDFMRAFASIVKQNIQDIKPDLVVIAGDVYDNHNPSNLVRSFFNHQVQKLVDAGIEVIILVGNHDICSKHHALSPLKKLKIKGVSVIEEPTLKSFGDKTFLLFPYSIKVEKEEISIKDQFYQFIEESHKTIKSDEEYNDKDIMFFGHFGVRGASMKTYNNDADTHTLTEKIALKKKKTTNISSKSISIDDLDMIQADYIFLGDYHMHQMLPTKNSIAMYTGSIERTDITESDQTKGYIVYDDAADKNKKMGKCRFVEYPGCRPMVEFKGSSQDILKAIDELSAQRLQEGIVKVKFVGTNKEFFDFSTLLEDIRKQIQAKFNPIFVFDETSITDVVSEEEVSQLEEEIMEKGHINEELVMQVVEEMISEKETDVDEQKLLIKIAQDIYKETTEGD